MTHQQLLAFLDLPPEATDNDIRVRLKDKLVYYRKLFENAPNDILKGMYAANIEKIFAGQKLRNFIEPAETAEENDYRVINNHQKGESQSPPVAWLIRHTENKPAKSFPLFAGRNLVGRVPVAGEHFILIDDDPFISRVHAVIEADVSASSFNLYDSASANGGKVSRNGTYVNGDERRITRKTRLFNNDTVQVGATKMVLKIDNGDPGSALTEVVESGYAKTVIIKIL